MPTKTFQAALKGAFMFSYESKGSTDNLEKFLKKISKQNLSKNLDRYGQQGVAALSSATPKETGEAAGAWSYKVVQKRDSFSIGWYNSDVEGGFPVAVMLQYGYSTGTGGYVSGRDYINPAIKPIFDRILEDVWREVNNG